MTEREWHKSADPKKMLEFVQGRDSVSELRRWRGDRVRQPASDRKVAQFNCACGRRLWDKLPEGVRQFLIAQESHADGEIDDETLKASWTSAASGYLHSTNWGYYSPRDFPPKVAFEASYASVLLTPNERVADSSTELATQARLLRDIFGNPFKPVAVDSTWLSSTVVSLATAIYDERAFDRLPILADALEDAGCTNADILNHCRQPGVHVRGCWPVDLVLGKS